MNPDRPLPRRWALGALLVAALAAAIWVLLRSGPLAAIAVTVTTVSQGVVQPAVLGVGTVEARRSWAVGPTATGRVARVAVDVGETVSPGQVLAEIDPVDLEQRLAALDAGLARARSAQLAAQAQVADAMARQQLSEANLRRNEELARLQFISAGALESRQQELASARAALQAAQANATASVQELQRLAAERAALVQQRQNLRLIAPAAAVVATREAEPGSTVAAGQPILRLIDPGSLWVKTRIDQSRSAQLAVGQTARVVLRAHGQTAFEGRVVRLEPLADAVTEERLVQVALLRPPLSLAVGEQAEVTIELPPTPAGLLVPNAAIHRRSAQTGVWKLDAQSRPHWVAVRTGPTSLDGQVRIEPLADGPATLAEGDRVVLHSPKPLQPGARLRIVPALVETSGGFDRP